MPKPIRARSFPRGFQPKLEGDIIGEVTPFSIYYLEYKDETRTKIVQWNNRYDAPEDIQYKNLKELANLIIEIIQDKPEYKQLLNLLQDTHNRTKGQ